MPNHMQAQQYPLPDNWSVLDTICVAFRIPNDLQYFSTLIGLLDTLKFSKNFARDETHTGAALVSRVWKAALESEPIRLVNCEDIDMAIDFRVKPGVPWVSQVSTDGGASWHDFLIQPNWAGGLVLPPNSGTLQGAKDMSAAMIETFFKGIIQDLIDALARDEPKAQTVQGIEDKLRPYAAGATLTDAIETLYDDFEALSDPDRADYLDDCAYLPFWVGAYATMNGSASSILDVWNYYLIAYLNNTSDLIMHDLDVLAVKLTGHSVWNYAVNNGGGGGGAGFGDACTWTHTYDGSAGGIGLWYAPLLNGIAQGTFDGTEWDAEFSAAWGNYPETGLPVSDGYRAHARRTSETPFTITSIEANVGPGAADGDTYLAQAVADPFGFNGQEPTVLWESSAQAFTSMSWAGVVKDIYGILLVSNKDRATASVPSHIFDCTISGIGLDPFPDDPT